MTCWYGPRVCWVKLSLYTVESDKQIDSRFLYAVTPAILLPSKGSLYWRFHNDVVDPGYPKLIHRGFDGLRGHITAALSVPQYQSRGESVYFFKRGDPT